MVWATSSVKKTVKSNLRGRLTVQFVLLFVILYFSGGAVAIFVFASQLDASLDDELQDLAYQILPAVEFPAGAPSLRRWASRAEARPRQVTFDRASLRSRGTILKNLDRTATDICNEHRPGRRKRP